MEQRIDPKTQSEHAVGTDPAYVPGLLFPRPEGGRDADPEQSGAETPEDDVPREAADVPDDIESESLADEQSASGPDDAPVADPAPDEGMASGTAEEAETGPVFEAADRRGAITADREGIRFRLDDEEADFRWDEIGAVELTSARFGRLFTVTVHVAANRWFNADVEAPARGRLKEWTAAFDAVLDRYFEGA